MQTFIYKLTVTTDGDTVQNSAVRHAIEDALSGGVQIRTERGSAVIDWSELEPIESVR